MKDEIVRCLVTSPLITTINWIRVTIVKLRSKNRFRILRRGNTTTNHNMINSCVCLFGKQFLDYNNRPGLDNNLEFGPILSFSLYI